MVVFPSRFASVRSLDVFWPERAEDVLPLLSEAPIVQVRQVSGSAVAGLEGLAFRRKLFPSLQIDLTMSQEELWRGLHQKAARRRVTRGEALGCRVLVNDRVDDALRLIGDHMARSGYTRPLSTSQWQGLLKRCDVFAVELDGRLLAAHVFIVDRERVRMHFSATVARSDVDQEVIGYANRYLHWQEMLQYKERGVSAYDLGGVVLDPDLPLYSIGQFKLSFGGEIVDEFCLYLAGNPLVRSALRAASATRLAMKRARGMRAAATAQPASPLE